MTLRFMSLCLFTALLLISSVALVQVQHERRGLFMELKGLEQSRDLMQVEWGQLQLEASTWAAQDRIEKIAVEQLHFRVPTPASVVLVQQ